MPESISYILLQELYLAHVALATPFVVITVTATLVGFDMNMVKASQSLGARPIKNIFSK